MKQREPTRKRKALRNWAVLLLLLVIANQTFLYLFPWQVRRNAQSTYETGETHVIWQELGIENRHLNYWALSENENAVLFTHAWLTLGGWVGGSALLDCTGGPKPWHVMQNGWESNDGQWRYVLFGRIDDPSAQTVTALVGFKERVDEPYGWGPADGAETLTADRAEWLTRNGRQYVFLETELPIPGSWERTGMTARVTLFDNGGRVIETVYDPYG